MINKLIGYFLNNKLVTFLLLILLVTWGIVTSPFGWKTGILPSDPVPVDAIPDIGENQQIVFTKWPGRSPQDIEDQITYPLTTSLLGIPGVKSIRSSSMFGFSSIYIIFNEDVEFYWSRSRILEKLNSLPSNLLPEGVQPTLGPDATALGQIYWYTLEGRDPQGNPTGGWDLQELRTIQDFYVKYALSSAQGVSEVASIGGYVKEYQVELRPEAMKSYGVSIADVVKAVKNSNRDVGAKTLEINKAEYLVRGIGYIKSTDDLRKAVVGMKDNVPVRIGDVARVTIGPASRRGILDKEGAEVVGGVVVARYGSNPLDVINHVKAKIAEISSGLPSRTLDDGTVSQLTIVPFYDRTQLIYETLGTLEDALTLEVIITIIVIIVMLVNLRASTLIAGLLPIAILMVFIAMRYTGVAANIVALSGIAIAIGTMVDLGIILTENIIRHRSEAPPDEPLRVTIYRASAEVSPAIITAVSTTIISFIPVFAMQAAEGKLFRPLAFTKTYALMAAVLVTLFILPALAHLIFGIRVRRKSVAAFFNSLLIAGGIAIAITMNAWGGALVASFGVAGFVQRYYGERNWWLKNLSVIMAVIAVVWLLARNWLPLGPERSLFLNMIFVGLLIALVLGLFQLVIRYYRRILDWGLRHKAFFLSIPVFIIILGLVIWIGFNRVFGFVANGFDTVGVNVRTTEAWSSMVHSFPGLGKEFMPSLDEGSFLLMPTSMPHSGIVENKENLQELDMLAAAIPEIDLVVGKLGRVDSPLDPAPISMYENVINYKTEYVVDEKGHRVRFKMDSDGNYVLKDGRALPRKEILAQRIKPDQLVEDASGEYFRQWRDKIKSPDDIWDEIVKATKLPGVTSAPKLQPIETRLVMLQTGMRAPMGIKVSGPDLKTIQDFGIQLENLLKQVPSVKKEAVFADRIVGKPYLHLNINRDIIARYGLSVEDVQHVIESAVGGMQITSTVEGRERFPVQVRYPRELRDNPEKLKKILVSTKTGVQVPLGELVEIQYVQGPQAIKSENTFLQGYVLFDKREGFSEVNVVNDAKHFIDQQIQTGSLKVPAGVSFRFSGNYENSVRAEKRLSLLIPLVLMIIFLILYFQFKSVPTALMVFSGVAVAFSGGFLMIWLYGQGWFADFSVFGTNLRDLFQMKPINLSVAVWVGFIALFGIATDDGVVMATYLDQSFARNKVSTRTQIREAVKEAGMRRIRPCLMTTATTLIALLPVLSSSGRGSDIMIPMAIPAFGGMTIALITLFVVPILYSAWKERSVQS